MFSICFPYVFTDFPNASPGKCPVSTGLGLADGLDVGLGEPSVAMAAALPEIRHWASGGILGLGLVGVGVIGFLESSGGFSASLIFFWVDTS